MVYAGDPTSRAKHSLLCIVRDRRCGAGCSEHSDGDCEGEACPRRAERGALARAGMARVEMRQRARAGAGDTGDTYLKQHDAPEDVEYYLCGPPMMAKTVLDLLHSLGVDDADIRFDNFGG